MDTLQDDINVVGEDDKVEDTDQSVGGDLRRALESLRSSKEEAGEQTKNETEGDKPSGRDRSGRFTKSSPSSSRTASQSETAPNAPTEADAAKKLAQGGPQTPHPSINPAPSQTAPTPQPQTGLTAPVGWPQTAKDAFATLPPHVQEAIAQREEQVNNGFKILQNYKGLENFQPYISQSGVSYAEVMDRAVKWEEATIRDPIGTILHLAKIRGISPQLLGQAIQNPQIAQQIRHTLAQRQQPQVQPQQPQLSPEQIRQMAREEFNQAHNERQINDDVSKFLADPENVHAEAVADDMVIMINSGRADTLSDAYQLALRLHPELAPPTVNRQQPNPKQLAADQARRAAKAITGSPVGSAPSAPGKSPETTRDAVRMAYNRARGLDE